MNANGWHWDIILFLFVLWIPCQHSVNGLMPMRDSCTDKRYYAQQSLHRAASMRTCSYTERERFVHRATFAQLGKNALFRRTCTVAVGTVRLFALPDPLHLVSFPSLRHLVSLKVIVLAANTVECQGHGQSWEIAYLPVCVSVLMHTSAVSK